MYYILRCSPAKSGPASGRSCKSARLASQAAGHRVRRNTGIAAEKTINTQNRASYGKRYDYPKSYNYYFFI